MTVKVKTADLRGYAGQLKANAGYTTKMLQHVQQFAGSDLQSVDSEGLLGKALTFHEQTYESVTNMLTHLGKVLHGSATELEAAAKFYDHADAAAEQRIEKAAFGFLAQTSTDKTVYGYKDAHDPTQELRTPYAEEYSDPYNIMAFLDSVGDMTSFAGLIFRAIEALTGRKVLEEVAEYFSGDWMAWGACANGWKQIGECMSQIGENLRRGAGTMDQAWDGDAAGEAYAYFNKMHLTLSSLKANFDKLHDAYEAYTKFVATLSSVVADLLKMLIDLGAVYLLKKDGGPMAQIALTVMQVKIVLKVAKFGYIMLSARGAVSAFFALNAGRDSIYWQVRDKLPEKSYDLQGV